MNKSSANNRYSLTSERLYDFLENLPLLFIESPIKILPKDCNIRFEDFNRKYDVPYEELRLSIRKDDELHFWIFDEDRVIENIMYRTDIPILHIVGTIIKCYSELKIIKYSDDSSDSTAARKPWVQLRHESISWLSENNCLEVGLFETLCGSPEEDSKIYQSCKKILNLAEPVMSNTEPKITQIELLHDRVIQARKDSDKNASKWQAHIKQFIKENNINTARLTDIRDRYYHGNIDKMAIGGMAWYGNMAFQSRGRKPKK